MENYPASSKKLFITTYGCQMNVYDSTQMQNIMLNIGYELCDNPQDANLIIINTCNIREKAADKLYSELGTYRKLKEKKILDNLQLIIIVAGCVGQAEGEEIFKRVHFVDGIVGPQSYFSLPLLIEKIENKASRVINLDFECHKKFDSLPEESLLPGVSAFVTIQEGCDKFCKFCVVPYTRGPEYSRTVAQIYREVLKLVSQGAKEIILLGQNVNAYHGQAEENQVFSLTQLIKLLVTIEGLKRIRYTTSHPIDMTDELINLHGSEPKLMPALHLPVQSGSNKILHLMNRNHSIDLYYETHAKLLDARPDLVMTSDFIVGFPGETEEDFQATLNLIKTIKFVQAYSFTYSPRPGTPASLIDDQIPEEIKIKRLYELQHLTTKLQKEYNQSFIGKEVEVLIEKIIKKQGQIMGRTPYMQNVYIDGNYELYGQLVIVKIIDATQTNLKGIVIER